MGAQGTTARANPNDALVQHWGKRQPGLNLPTTGSISLTLDGLAVEAKVAFGGGEADRLEIDGEAAVGDEAVRDRDDQVARVGVLARLAVDLELEIEGGRILHLVRADEPRPEHGVAVDRLAQAALLRPAHGDVKADAVTGDVFERALLRYTVGALADDDRQLDLVIGTPVEMAHRD